jgi:deoxyribodipyrimidine photolyase
VFSLVIYLSSSGMSRPTVIHWFRKGLRLHDNPALLAGLEKVVELP